MAAGEVTAMARGTRDQAEVPAWIEPMLAKPDGGRLRSGRDWAYEYKLDGYRAAMRIAGDGTMILTSRNGIDFTEEFPTLSGVLGGALDGQAAVLDGEIVVYNQAGQVDFGLMQHRRGRYRKHLTAGLAGLPFEDLPVRFLAFDLLQLGDTSLLNEPYDRRRALLRQIPMPDPYLISVVPAFTFDELAADRLTPQNLLDRIAGEGHEGLIAKHRSATYTPGKRTDAWLKHALTQTQEVIICGWRPGQRSFEGTLGGLLLGAHDPATGDLIYLGDVGTGFSQLERLDLREQLQPLERRSHPFAVRPPREDVVRARWVEPILVGEVRYRQFTRGEGRLRHTAWRGLRHDRSPDEIIAPQAKPQDPAPPPPRRVTVQVGKRRLTLSNLEKPLYPNGFTKAQVISYYTQIAPVLLPHLAGRPVTFIRFPDGVAGERFFEKNAAPSAPDWLTTVPLPSSGSRGTGDIINYPLIDDLPALVWAANLAALELHVPQWTVIGGVRNTPDLLVFDLDPGAGTTIVDCARVAQDLHDILTADGLTTFAKTSGSKGMQLYAAIHTTDPRAPSAYAKSLAERLARTHPGRVTAKMTKTLRTGKVFIDWSQNNPAKTTIAPYSLRGRERPTVSTPVTWDEIRTCQRPEQLQFTAQDVLDRVSSLGDLLADLAPTRTELPSPM